MYSEENKVGHKRGLPLYFNLMKFSQVKDSITMFKFIKTFRYVSMLLLILFAKSAVAQTMPQGGYIDWSPNGSMLAVASNSTVKILDASSGQILNTLPSFIDKVPMVDWSPDGTKLAIATGTEVQIWNNVWNSSTASAILNFQGHHISRVGSIAWDNTGNRIVSASADKALIWNSQTAQIQQTLIQIPGPIFEAVWSPSGDIVATSGFASQVIFWNPSNGQIVGGIGVLYGSGVTLVSAISWKPDGSQIATSSEEGIIRIWDITQSSAVELVTLYGHTKYVTSLAWKPDGDQLASSSLDGTIRIWNTSTTEQLQVNQVNLLTSVTWRPDGSGIIYADTNGIVQNIIAPTKRNPHRCQHPHLRLQLPVQHLHLGDADARHIRL